MKKRMIALVACAAMLMGLAACTQTSTQDPTTTTVADETTAAEKTVLSYAEYVAAELETEVTVVTYVQAKEGWWKDAATVYTADKDGAYFLYSLPCSQEDYELLVPGTKIQVTGFKTAYANMVEIVDATFTILTDDTYVADAKEVAAADMANYSGALVAVKGLTVVESTDKDGNTAPFLYSWDGSGSQGGDVYFNVSDGTNTYTLNVRAYLTGADTDVYKAAEALTVGATIDIEGYVYMYNDQAQTRVTAISVQ